MTESNAEIDYNMFAAYNMLLSFAGSFILFKPEQGCINDLISQNLLSELPVSSNNPKFILAASRLRKLNNGSALDYDAIINDHLELFGGKGKAMAPPYGSVYLSKDRILNDKETLEVRSLYNAYGWKSNFENKIPDDHIGVELQFINVLLEKYPRLEDGICRRELNKDLREFLENYILPWIDEWNSLVQKNAATDFYKGIAYLVVSSLEDIYSELVAAE